MPMIPGIQKNFVGRLESLRGVAAVCVAICHSMIWMPVFGDPVAGRPIADVAGLQALLTRVVVAITNGSAAVDIFFVLSGFVLARSLKDKQTTAVSWYEFIIKRAFRIFPPYLVWLFPISIFLIWREQAGPPDVFFDSAWFGSLPFSVFELAKNSFLMSTGMNQVAWTIKVEMLAGIIFPLLMVIFYKSRPALSFSVLLIALLVLDALASTTGERPWFYFIYLFSLGILTERFGTHLIQLFTDRALPLLFFFSILLIVVPGFFTLQHRITSDLLIGIGAAALISVLASNRSCIGTIWLDAPMARFMGRISYSFYLVHFFLLYLTTLIVQYSLGKNIVQRWPAPTMGLTAIISIVASIPIAYFLYRTIELPSIGVAKSLVRRKIAITIVNKP